MEQAGWEGISHSRKTLYIELAKSRVKKGMKRERMGLLSFQKGGTKGVKSRKRAREDGFLRQPLRLINKDEYTRKGKGKNSKEHRHKKKKKKKSRNRKKQ